MAKARGHRDLVVGTLYSQQFTWPHVIPFADKGFLARRQSHPHQIRAIKDEFDGGLVVYEETAPGRQPRSAWDEMAEALHAWNGKGEPPFDLDEAQAKGPLTYILPIARWHQAGCPMEPDEEGEPFVPFEHLKIDEAQDVGRLELASAFALVHPEGEIVCYGDPGQSIFAEGKGVRGQALPPALALADETITLKKGWRCGPAIARSAARVLDAYWSRSASTFEADHPSFIFDGWEPSLGNPPATGLVLGMSHLAVADAFRTWGLKQTWLVPGPRNPDDELIVCTGHSAKGSEADDVYLLPWSPKGLARLENRDSGALRLLYVMLTRARKRVFVPDSLSYFL